MNSVPYMHTVLLNLTDRLTDREACGHAGTQQRCIDMLGYRSPLPDCVFVRPARAQRRLSQTGSQKLLGYVMKMEHNRVPRVLEPQ